MPKIIYVENLLKGPFFALLNCVCTTGLLLQNKESSVEDQNFSLVMNCQMKKMNYSNTYLAALILMVLTKEFVCIIKCFLRKFKLSMDIEILKDILFLLTKSRVKSYKHLFSTEDFKNFYFTKLVLDKKCCVCCYQKLKSEWQWPQ